MYLPIDADGVVIVCELCYSTCEVFCCDGYTDCTNCGEYNEQAFDEIDAKQRNNKMHKV